jgi:hypothetical protein
MMKIEGSGSISQSHGSADPDPDPHQNVMDPQNWLQSGTVCISGLNTVLSSVLCTVYNSNTYGLWYVRYLPCY